MFLQDFQAKSGMVGNYDVHVYTCTCTVTVHVLISLNGLIFVLVHLICVYTWNLNGNLQCIITYISNYYC